MKTVDIDGLTILLEIMDTAGTEQVCSSCVHCTHSYQFTAMRDLYIKEGEGSDCLEFRLTCTGFILVFSLVSDGTLTYIERLVEQIQKVKDEDQVPMTLVGNKADLVEKRQVI